jgi:glycosyltransferase involved in cell wall biosynthesis
LSAKSTLPLVSIVTPSFNQGAFIGDTIESILAQDYAHIEHIVIDGGSTDDTIGVLQHYNEKISWTSEPDRGQSDAINKGFLKARGEILTWLCADDVYERNTVSTVVSFFEEHPATSMVYGECLYIDAAGQIIGTYPGGQFDVTALLPFCFIPQPTAFIRKSVLDRVGFVDAELHFAMDLDLWARIAANGRVDFIPSVLARYRLHDGTKTVSASGAVEREGIRVRERYLNDASFRKCLGASYRDVSHQVYLKAASFYFYEAELAKTSRYLMKAFVANPKSWQIWGIPFYAWRAIRRMRTRRMASCSSEHRIEHLIGTRPRT